MSRMLSEEDLEGRMDCFGEFQASDEICLKYCGINISCASKTRADQDQEWFEEGFLDLPDVELD